MLDLEIEIPEAFEPFITPMRYKGAWGGRGSGKSQFFASQIIFRTILAPCRVVCLREVQNTIKDSVKQLLTDIINRLGLNGTFFTVLDNEIRATNGSMIIFKGMQSFNADNIKSLEGFDIAWVEEAQTLSQFSLDLLRPTIRKPMSELWFSWNPRYKTDAVDKFFRKDKRDNAICVMANWSDNPWFKDTPLYRDMLDDFAADPDKAEHVWNGAYGSSVGAILARWVNDAEREGRINDVKVDRHGSGIVVSSDLGFRDTAAWWYWQPVVGGFNVVHYQQGHGWDADDWIPEIKKTLAQLGAKLDKIWLPHDARSKTFQSKHTSQEKFQAGFGVDKIRIVPQSRKADQIEAARDTIKRCVFNAQHCEQGLDGLRAWEFVYNDDAGIFSREPNHNWASHPSDAFAYGCQVMRMEEPAKPPPPKPKFWDSQTLDELWKNSQTKSSKRI